MESEPCDGTRSDSDVLLPPRKRLLAGFKKRNVYKKPENPSTSREKVSLDTQIDSLLKYHLENPNVSPKDIIEKSRKAAEEAADRAVAARAVAEEKAVIAAKAMEKAKSALEIVAGICDEMYGYDRRLKKNKTKKHLPAKLFYKKRGENCKTDEEVARRLHHAINSSPRIVKNSANSDLEINKHKRTKGLSNGHDESEAEETDSEDLTGEVRVVGVSEHTIRHKSLKIVNGEAESSHSKEMKQKKLPISTCDFRGLTITNDEIQPKSTQLSEVSIENNNAASTFLAKRTSMWKRKASKAPDCVKQNDVMEP